MIFPLVLMGMTAVYDIFAVYIASEDGRELFRRVYRGVPAKSELLTDFIVALNSFCRETTSGTIDEIRSGDIYYFVKHIDPIFVIVITPSRKDMDHLVETIAYRFVEKYGSVLQNWKGRVVFNDFKLVLDELLQMEGTQEEKIIIKPDKVLDSIAIVGLEPDIQKTALVLLEIRRGAAEDIAKSTGKSIDDVKSDLEHLIRLGYVGKIIANDVKWYFVK